MKPGESLKLGIILLDDGTYLILVVDHHPELYKAASRRQLIRKLGELVDM